MKFYFYPVAVFLAGIASAQALFSVFVYFSDVSLYHTLTAIKAAGFVVVPNAQVLPSLLKWRPAFCGGVFFALTTGAGLTVATFLVVSIWRRFSRRSFGLWLVFAAAAGFLAIRFHYHLPMILACGLTIAAAGAATFKFFPDLPDSDGRNHPLFSLFIAHLAVIGIILAIWVPRFNGDAFVSIRDYLLLSNPIGEKINAFYYRYTLYPAEAFKSLDQKLLKSCIIKVADKNLYDRIKTTLIERDYLPVQENFAADVIINEENNALIFQRHGKKIDQLGIEDFLKAPDTVLEKISEKTDPAGFLRKITFLSLIGVSPLISYIFLHSLIMSGLFFIRSWKPRFAAAGLLCVLVFTGPAFLFGNPLDKTASDSDLSQSLASARWRDRVAALKIIEGQELPLHRFSGIEAMAQSSVTPERYWAARVLGDSRASKSYELILKLLDDPQPNVACMALYSLGKQKNARAVPDILRRMNSSDHWYVQWYAYKALKRLGWTQKK